MTSKKPAANAIYHEIVMASKPKPITIAAAKRIAKEFGYDQVIVLARKTGASGVEHATTYGINKEHCAIAARTGNFLKYKIMGWPEK